MILDSWLAAYYWSEIPKDHGEFANIAIEMNGQDNYVTNVCVPSAYAGPAPAACLLCLSRLSRFHRIRSGCIWCRWLSESRSLGSLSRRLNHKLTNVL